MSLTALFVVGFVVTLIVGSAVALLIYAAVLDGRRQRELTGEAGVPDVPVYSAVFADPSPESPTDAEPLPAAVTG